MATYMPEPYRIKMVEPLKVTTRKEREEAIRRAHFNLFGLKSDEIYIDMLTDSGTGAMSDRQWAAIMMGDESYAGSRSYYSLMEVCQELFGWKYFQPVHQGRAAEKVLFPNLLKKGQISISNMHFDTTAGHVMLCGAKPVNCVDPRALDPDSLYPFKGNMDNAHLEELIEQYGHGQVGMIVITVTCNSAGGQPVSLANMEETAAIARLHGIPLVIDAARFAENAFFIKEREEGQSSRSIREIVRLMFAHADAFTFSAKKDGIVNMGGLVAVREDEKLIEGVRRQVVPSEGFLSYGGLAGRDMEALAVGLEEGLDEAFLRSYTGQTRYLVDRFIEEGIPCQRPAGGHAVFVDAGRLLPHISYDRFPAQSLCVEAYREAGIRGCDVGSFMLDPDPVTGLQPEAAMEFARFCIPRRTYTQAHLDYVVASMMRVMEKANTLRGYRIVRAEKILRHFTARLEPDD
ncbi:MAG TPA: tryptophanase [Bacillota bacterium]|mgnify:CR=1 FL=1|nr:tryptophanase [Fastidiosipila sp.]HPX93603.1 tryptophanase [Bacillota bacterium]HQB81537.1 tryptophanase [Bacillota bacterium]